MTKNCIVSLATKNGVYVDRLARLSSSLRDNLTDGDFLGFIHESSVGAPLHTQNAYAFKIYAIKKCIEAGYKNILWLDTSFFAVKNVQPIFDEIENNGYFLHNSHNRLADWCNDFTLSYFGITRSDLKELKMVDGGFLGFNFNNKRGYELFSKWEQSMSAGCFKGSWDNHRHDMSSINCILYKSENKYIVKPQDEVIQYAGLFDETANGTIIFKGQG